METPQQSRRLTDEEMETWHALAGVMVRLPSALDAQLQRDSGLSHVEYLVMSMLSQTEGRILRMSDLAGYVGSSLSRLSHLVKRLEKSEWMRREPDPTDGRYTLAVLTDAGHAKVVESAPGHMRRRTALCVRRAHQGPAAAAAGHRAAHLADRRARRPLSAAVGLTPQGVVGRRAGRPADLQGGVVRTTLPGRVGSAMRSRRHWAAARPTSWLALSTVVSQRWRRRET